MKNIILVAAMAIIAVTYAGPTKKQAKTTINVSCQMQHCQAFVGSK